MQSAAPVTPLDALIAALIKASEYDPRAEAAPAAALWCDPGCDFESLLPLIRTRLPGFLSLGDHDSAAVSGPAIWLRVAADRSLAEVSWPSDRPAIIYLPGIGRETFKTPEDCPVDLALLAWFMIAGSLFGHTNGKDWTLRGFLASKPSYGGLGLEVPQDEATRSALAAAAPKLFVMPIDQLRERRLDAPALHAILAPDVEADTLDWIGGYLTEEIDPPRFTGFRERARAELNLDPGRTAPDVAARRLANGEGRWASVWQRFASEPAGIHESVADVLETLEPPDLFADARVWPAANARAEAELRAALAKLPDQPFAAACETLLALAAKHAPRRDGPWAARGKAPLAHAVVHLTTIAAAPTWPSDNLAALANAYAAEGWKVDWAALAALAAAPANDDRLAIAAALRSVYWPWLEQGAVALQKANHTPAQVEPEFSEVDAVLFVDGLRMDLAQKLAEGLRGAGASVELGWRWAGFPTVTATCKPLSSPVASRFLGGDAATDFLPVATDGRPAAKPVLERELAAGGWHPSLTLLADQKCWLETGHFDADGHGMGVRLADQIAHGLNNLRDQALQLARAGRRVRIITDHGWLLLPGGLPVAKLETGLTETKWTRCAMVKEGARTTVPQMSWSWNRAVLVASAPGIHAFRAGQEYAHGGISPQESVAPVLTISPVVALQRAVIADAEWNGLRIRVRAENGDGLTADLRKGPEGDGGSIVDRPRALDAEGRTSLLVPDDGLVGERALVVLENTDGKVVTSRQTTVGG